LPQDAKQDPTYVYSMVQQLCRKDKACQQDRVPELARMLLSVPQDPAILADTDEWWIARRIITRKLLDSNDPQTAYRVAAEAAAPTKPHYRVEQQFMAGWIALRFLKDPDRAMPHFVKIAEGTGNPVALSRSEYWQGRAEEAKGRVDEAR